MNDLALKQIIANNISFLLSVRKMSRKEICNELGIKYTTFCDWMNAKTYPRIDSLVVLANYFGIEIQYFFVDIEANEKLAERVREYARRLNMKKDYTDTYPTDFFELFGSINENDGFEIPEDNLPEDEVIF